MYMYILLTSADIDDWGVSPRGAGFLFGSDVVSQVHVYTTPVSCSSLNTAVLISVFPLACLF